MVQRNGKHASMEDVWDYLRGTAKVVSLQILEKCFKAAVRPANHLQFYEANSEGAITQILELESYRFWPRSRELCDCHVK